MKATKRDIFIASMIIVAYMSTLTYAILSLNGTLVIMSTLLLTVVLYASYRIDRENKRYTRQKEREKALLNRTLTELEKWREMKEGN